MIDMSNRLVEKGNELRLLSTSTANHQLMNAKKWIATFDSVMGWQHNDTDGYWAKRISRGGVDWREVYSHLSFPFLSPFFKLDETANASASLSSVFRSVSPVNALQHRLMPGGNTDCGEPQPGAALSYQRKGDIALATKKRKNNIQANANTSNKQKHKHKHTLHCCTMAGFDGCEEAEECTVLINRPLIRSTTTARPLIEYLH